MQDTSLFNNLNKKEIFDILRRVERESSLTFYLETVNGRLIEGISDFYHVSDKTYAFSLYPFKSLNIVGNNNVLFVAKTKCVKSPSKCKKTFV